MVRKRTLIAYFLGLFLILAPLAFIPSNSCGAVPARIAGVATYGIHVPRPSAVPSPGRHDSERNLVIRQRLIDAWNSELNGVATRSELRRNRYWQARYFIWMHYVYEAADRYGGYGGGYVWSAARYVKHKYRVGDRVFRVKPPAPFTIGPVEWNISHRAWEPGLGQPTPCWYVAAVRDRYPDCVP